jgi:dTDP-4-dehydrorhamnose reductase
MKILITGKDGQLGQCFADAFRGTLHQVTFVGRREFDLSNKNSVINYLNQNKFDLIINCAAYTNVELAEDQSELANQINGHAIKTIAENHSGHIIHFSTDYIFDGTKSTPYTTLDTPNPISAYGASKLMGERPLMSMYAYKASMCVYYV